MGCVEKNRKRGNKMKAIIDQEACIGCGLCAQVASDVFDMKGDKAVSKVKDLSEDMVEAAKSAADQCPVAAITVS